LKGDRVDSANRNLATKARELSLKAFGVFPDIPFSFNSRLKRILGRLVYSRNRGTLTPLRIEISYISEMKTSQKDPVAQLSHFYL
jgi:SprT-like protein